MSHSIAPPVHDTDPAELKPTDPLVFDRATSDLLATRLGNLETSLAAISAAVLAIRDVTDAIPRALHDVNGHLAGIKANQESLERLVTSAIDSQTEIVTDRAHLKAIVEELVHDVAIIKMHQPSVNGSVPEE